MKMMKALTALVPLLLAARALAGCEAAGDPAKVDPGPANHRYVIERTYPPGALDGLDEVTKAQVNANNAKVGVRWITSYTNADRTKTFCIYYGPSEDAIRLAAALNKLPVDRITEVPVDLTP